MKTTFLFSVIVCLCLFTGCLHKRQPLPSQATPGGEVALIGGADGSTSIIVSDESSPSDSDTIIYQSPQFQLWYTEALAEEYKDKGIRMWTEYANYWENLQTITVFVANPTDTPFQFGREFELRWLKDGKWIFPQQRDTSHVIVWKRDGLISKKAPLLYCFRYSLGDFYMLPGKYRLLKSFWQGRKEIKLAADFHIPEKE